MPARLLREEARLRELFQRLVAVGLAAAPLGAVEGCSSAGDDSAAPIDAGARTDATLAPLEGGAAADATAIALDAGAHDAACDPVYLDGEADGSGCDFFEHLACNLPPGTATEGCAIFLVTCTQICGQTAGYPCKVSECDDGSFPSGPITVECTTGKIGCADGGRRPAGLVEPRPEAERENVTALGAWLARLAWMEAASVHAFRALRDDLVALGAPASLVRRAERAARDEAVHARVVARLARGHGGKPRRARVVRRRRRSLEALARHNAVEGCVREAFAALVATWQARHAPEAEIAAAMARIAADETRHAALAWAVAGWLGPKLGPASRRDVRAAMDDAVRALRCEIASLAAPLARDAGLPSGRDGAALVEGFARELGQVG
jgi:hypothetical protein